MLLVPCCQVPMNLLAHDDGGAAQAEALGEIGLGAFGARPQLALDHGPAQPLQREGCFRLGTGGLGLGERRGRIVHARQRGIVRDISQDDSDISHIRSQ